MLHSISEFTEAPQELCGSFDAGADIVSHCRRIIPFSLEGSRPDCGECKDLQHRSISQENLLERLSILEI